VQNTKRNILDLINRQKAEIKKKDIEIDILIRKNETLKDEIAEVKSESKPKQGKWLINPDGYYPYCSECGYEPKAMTKFCPECGADMKRKKAESDVTLQ
jgi:predicted Zn-ribbon and HTH transcriptional regulator